MESVPLSEIKVAILGHVSVGKTTVLNAILGDKFGEVSMRRTTAGINFFRIVPSTEATTEQLSKDWLKEEGIKTADKVHEEIEESNKKLRAAQQIEEKWFNVARDPLCEMRENTSLVLVDIPGINEADSNSIYMNYVQTNWKSFDCVVVVMDARQGVNTEEQVGLLRLVKENLSKKKPLPVIVLFNKVDEPDDTEQALLVQESQKKIASMFGVGCREEAVKQLPKLSGKKGAAHAIPISDLYPVVIPVSAIRAFFYRSASSLSFEEFRKKFDKEIVDKIGREELSRHKWRKMSIDQKYKALYDLVVDGSEDDEEVTQGTGFDTFLCALSVSVGGHETQTKLLHTQLDAAIQSMNNPSCSQLKALHQKSNAINKDMGDIKKTFWTKYASCKEEALETLSEGPRVEVMAQPAALLHEYFSFATSVGWNDEAKLVEKSFGKLIHEQLGVIVNKQNLDLAAKAHLSRGGIEDNCRLCSDCRGTEDSGKPRKRKQLVMRARSTRRKSYRSDDDDSTSSKRRKSNRSVDDDSVVILDHQQECYKHGELTWDALSLYDWIAIFQSFLHTMPFEVLSEDILKIEMLKDEYVSHLPSTMMKQCECIHCYNKNEGSFGDEDLVCNSCGTDFERADKCQKTIQKDNWKVYSEGGRTKIVGRLANIEIPSSPLDKKHWGHVAWSFRKLTDSARQHASG
ncbi:unknown protein [Seminavis robusta]|uniref:Dynamin N-terminal domain-containing protein n=1 Tax=Seminavis robusta TaxID=568900 RepID=A0A9N8DS09_9STRA|nr:unknown protein [Seminavis robusta]|eukprot:Sro247_g097970.1 n/a (686) ;mRNA; f:9673-11730